MIERFDFKERFIAQMRDGIGLFAGAGFSVLASDKDGNPLPIGSDLLDELKKEFPQIQNFPDLSKASTILEATYREEFYKYLTERFHVSTHSPLYDVLTRVNITDIFTTNIDDLIYQIYENSNLKYINTTTTEGASYGNGMAVNYSPLHGCVLNPEKGFLFSKTQLSSAYTNQRDDWTNLRNSIGNKPMLFWGWRFEDSDAIEALYAGRINLSQNDYKWILLKDPEDYEITFYSTLGFKIIIGDTESLLKEMNQMQAKNPSTSVQKCEIILPEYSIPSESKTALHPLLSFFEGDAPQWSHIRSGGIRKTHYYSLISDSIDKGRNLFVIGIPASGKTTLMMQLIYGYYSKVAKHFLTAPSLNEVKLYLNKLGKNKSLLFVDECFRDYRSVLELIKAPNVQIVCFDRDYFYESQAYRVRDMYSGFDVIDITEIDERDSREIVDSIPSGIRKNNTTIAIDDRTIYAILTRNMNTKRFERRFRKMVKEFHDTNPVATELFVMICYVHSCGVPVSFDMVYSYLSDLTTDYQEIYRYIREVGNIIVECGDSTFSFLNVNFEEQDYYQSRSRYFAEQILANLPRDPNILKTVLVRFVENVPSFRICRFDVFKRRGFDADFTIKAFENMADGEDYYEKCALIDESEYIYQQAALYFSRKREYTYAFRWIELAKNFSSFNRFSINNTHAIIQFNANIEIEDDDSGIVKNLLEDSLITLQECYSGDRRKTIHVMSFATLTVKFAERFGLDSSLNYLKQAKKWLECELSSKDCGYKMKKDMSHVYIQIQDILSGDL